MLESLSSECHRSSESVEPLDIGSTSPALTLPSAPLTIPSVSPHPPLCFPSPSLLFPLTLPSVSPHSPLCSPHPPLCYPHPPLRFPFPSPSVQVQPPAAEPGVSQRPANGLFQLQSPAHVECRITACLSQLPNWRQTHAIKRGKVHGQWKVRAVGVSKGVTVM